jgi:rhamnosyltransferase
VSEAPLPSPPNDSVAGPDVPRVAAVIVTYHPDWELLAARMDGIRDQVAEVVVVDNGSPVSARHPPVAGVHWLPLGTNLGLARAQNAGIERAREIGATHVLLLDQDSEPSPDMVPRLLVAARSLSGGGSRIAAVAPTYLDERRGGLAPFARIRGLAVERFGCDAGDRIVATDVAIASGSLIPLATLRAVGGMREALFIDLVDIEWCFRARSLGYRSFGVCDAALRHSLGETPRNVLGRKITHHGPLRSYYFFRNAVWLFGRGYMPLAWKLAVAGQLLRRGLYYPLAVAPRWEYLRRMLLGVWHGLRGRLGRLDED